MHGENRYLFARYDDVGNANVAAAVGRLKFPGVFFFVSAYVYMYLYIYIYIFFVCCVFSGKYLRRSFRWMARISRYVSSCMCVCLCVYVYVHVHRMCVCVCGGKLQRRSFRGMAQISRYVFLCVCAYVYTYMNIYIYKYMYIYVHCVDVCVCVWREICTMPLSWDGSNCQAYFYIFMYIYIVCLYGGEYSHCSFRGMARISRCVFLGQC